MRSRGRNTSRPLLSNHFPSLPAKPLRDIHHRHIAVLLSPRCSRSFLPRPHLAHQQVCAGPRSILRVNNVAEHEVLPRVSPLGVWTVSADVRFIQITAFHDAYCMDDFVHEGCGEEEVVPELRAAGRCFVAGGVGVVGSEIAREFYQTGVFRLE